MPSRTPSRVAARGAGAMRSASTCPRGSKTRSKLLSFILDLQNGLSLRAKRSNLPTQRQIGWGLLRRSAPPNDKGLQIARAVDADRRAVADAVLDAAQDRRRHVTPARDKGRETDGRAT